MTNRLDPIIAQKQREIADLQAFLQAHPDHAIAQLLQGTLPPPIRKGFKQALQGPDLAVIAEIKRKSPSKGDLASIVDPIALAKTYLDGGAAALSILTDEVFFKGHLTDLTAVSQACAHTRTPILRKDFILDVSQIAEAVVAGADAILAIVAVLGTETNAILQAAKALGIAVLVEVHTEAELELAIACGADIIGVNNRDLTTFQLDCQRAMDLVSLIPAGIIRVAESGIHDPELARAYHQLGYDAVLIGEALVTTQQPAQFIHRCQASAKGQSICVR